MKRDERRDMREKLEPRLEVFRQAARKNVLQTAWLRDVRQALGVPASEVAHRAKTSRAAVYRAEQDELKGWVTLATLDEVAHAMGCRVVYGIVPYGNEPLEALAQSLKKYPQRDTPRLVARREKGSKKVWDDLQEWRRKQVWERAADRKAEELRQRILERAKSHNWSMDAAEAAEKAKETAGSEGGPVESTSQRPEAEAGYPPVPRTAEEMRRTGVGGAEALRAALAERLRR